ncbi:hypothetical protein [Bradyrhizobium archetypum]|uniref:hypothetical protein n=1 Tax=Bradyrhizobium archetypum TaxID=2721160 RepID=UPI001AEDD391|nr:hypothetical protein [Bradyrhizobium archetypum]
MPAKTFVVQQLDAAQIAIDLNSSAFWSSDFECRSIVETRTIPSLSSYSFRMSSIVRALAGSLSAPPCADTGPNL